MRTFAALTLFSIALTATAQTPAKAPSAGQTGKQTAKLADWKTILADEHPSDKACGQARKLCESYTSAKDVSTQLEAQKCMVRVALCGKAISMVAGDDSGSSTIRKGYPQEAAEEASKHLEAALKLAPQDLSLHIARIHILMSSGRYNDIPVDLEKSVTTYKGNDGLPAWLSLAPDLDEIRQYKAGIDAMKVLDKHYPNNPDVLSNLGAFYTEMKQDADAVSYLRRAVELAPNDPINAWDFGRALDATGKTDEADRWYQKSLSLDTDANRHKESACVYAEFVEKKLKDKARACGLEKADCPAEKQTACGTGSGAKN